MFNFLKRLWHDRRGNALIIAAACLPMVVGAAGLANDTIQWTLLKRQLQRSADSAALAGVYGKLASQTVTTGDCSSSTTNPAIARDLAQSSVASRTGTTLGTTLGSGGTTLTCAAESPPTSGNWTLTSWKAVKVTLAGQRALAFTSFFRSSPMTLSASATAAYVQSGSYCMVSLDNNVEEGIDFSGNPTVNLGCGMKTNARGAGAIDCGGNATITATPVAAVGQITPCSNFGTGTTFQNYSPPQTDPFGSVNAPSVPNGCNQDLAYNGQDTSVTVTGSTTGWANNSPTTVCYTDFTVGSGKTFTGSDLLIIIDKKQANGSNGNLTLQGTVTCTRCVFVLTSDSSATPPPIGNVSVNSTALLNLSAPTVGTYANILIYQDRRASLSDCNNWCNQINGAANSVIQGAIYMPNQNVQMNGNANFNTNCLQMVAWRIQFTGTTGVTNTCPDGSHGHTFDGYMVRLVE